MIPEPGRQKPTPYLAPAVARKLYTSWFMSCGDKSIPSALVTQSVSGPTLAHTLLPPDLPHGPDMLALGRQARSRGPSTNSPKGLGRWPRVSAGRPGRKAREQTEPSFTIPGQGAGPEQVPSLPGVSVSSFVEGAEPHHLQGPSGTQSSPRPAGGQAAAGLGALLHLSPGASSVIRADLDRMPNYGKGIALNILTTHPGAREVLCSSRIQVPKQRLRGEPCSGDPRVKRRSPGLKPGVFSPEPENSTV